MLAPSWIHANCELFIVMYMPIWAAVLASYIGASTMGSFLLVVSLTTSAVLVIVPSNPLTLSAICFEIAVFALILSLYPCERLVNDCESVIGNSTRLTVNQTTRLLVNQTTRLPVNQTARLLVNQTTRLPANQTLNNLCKLLLTRSFFHAS